MEMKIREQQQRYAAAAHAMQTGVMWAIEKALGEKPKLSDEELHIRKHLRTGINSAMVDSSAIAKLLMAKGVFTELEYYTALADGMEAERDLYLKRLIEQGGFPPQTTLG